jgi:hypothetical protein
MIVGITSRSGAAADASPDPDASREHVRPRPVNDTTEGS